MRIEFSRNGFLHLSHGERSDAEAKRKRPGEGDGLTVHCSDTPHPPTLRAGDLSTSKSDVSDFDHFTDAKLG